MKVPPPLAVWPALALQGLAARLDLGESKSLFTYRIPQFPQQTALSHNPTTSNEELCIGLEDMLEHGEGEEEPEGTSLGIGEFRK